MRESNSNNFGILQSFLKHPASSECLSSSQARTFSSFSEVTLTVFFSGDVVTELGETEAHCSIRVHPVQEDEVVRLTSKDTAALPKAVSDFTSVMAAAISSTTYVSASGFQSWATSTKRFRLSTIGLFLSNMISRTYQKKDRPYFYLSFFI